MDNLRGIVLMIISMIGFTIEDLFIKSLSATLPVGQILILIGIGAGAVLCGLSRLKGERFFIPAAWSPLVILRAMLEAGAAVAFATSLSLVDLSVVAAVFQALPLVITMGAALFLGETVGWRRWSAIAVGLIGVLMIICPGFEGFEPSALLVLISVLGVATRDLITRRIDASVPSGVVSAQAFIATAIAGGIVISITPQQLQPLYVPEWKMAFMAVTFGVIGYLGIVNATRIAEASVVTPFRYSRILFALIFAVVIFRETLDTLMLIGVAITVASGLFTLLRERRAARG